MSVGPAPPPPEQLLARFRTLAFERLEHIESAWLALTHGGGVSGIEDEMLRDLHTLKGDARVVGLADVSVLCQRLEDLFEAARAHGFRVNEDIDIVVNMAVQFVGMLVRQKPGTPRRGIDLNGFLRQIDDILTDWQRRRTTDAQAVGAPGPLHVRPSDAHNLVSLTARDRLSIIATSVYLEHLRVPSGASRSRLHEIWSTLVRELQMFDAVPLAPLVERQAAAAMQLARELGKSVAIACTTGTASVSMPLIDAVSTATLHLLRNAIDHGIESERVRADRAKPKCGAISISAVPGDDGLELVIADDGAGIDLEEVRRRAIALGLLSANETDLTDERGLAVLFEPGFSTRDEVTEVSGRGIGLDAVRAAIARVGGKIHIESTRGEGTRVFLTLPLPRTRIDVHAFRGARSNVLFAVPTSWNATLAGLDSCPSVDMTEDLALPPVALDQPVRVVQLRRERMSISFAASSAPERATAMRICATPAEQSIEIIDVGKMEAILIRPEVIVAEHRARSGQGAWA